MRTLRISITVAAVAITGAAGCSSPSSVEAQGTAEKAVLQAQAERFRASVAQDAKALDRIMADELWYCRPSGYCENKPEFLRLVTAFALPGVRMSEMVPVGPMKVTVYGDTAMVTGKFDQKVTQGEKFSNQHFLILEMWVKRDGRWQLAKFQATDPPNDPHRYNDCEEAGKVFNPNDRWTGPYVSGTKTGAENDVLKAQEVRFRASVAGDAKAAESVVADELSYCRASGNCEDKSKYLQAVGGTPGHVPTGMKVWQMWPEHMKVNVYGNSATVVGRMNQVIATGEANPPSGQSFLILETYVKREGRWQLAGFMASDIAGWSPHRCGTRTTSQRDAQLTSS